MIFWTQTVRSRLACARAMKGETVAVEGRVIEVHRGGLNRVQLDNGHEVLARKCGKLVKVRLVIVAGDRVVVEVRPVDLTRGRIVRRLPG